MCTSVIIAFGLQIILCSGKSYPKNVTRENGLRTALAVWPMKFDPKNMVVSLLPLRLALNKLASVADGEAKTELMTVLGVKEDIELTKYYKNLTRKIQCLRESDLIMLNKMFIRSSDASTKGFRANAMNNFGVQVDSMRFDIPSGALSYINRWVDTDTYKRIPNILKDEDIDSHTSILLLNALHMKPTWEYPHAVFDIRLSVIKPFNLQNNKGQVNIRMMTSLYKMYDYCENAEHNFQVLVIPLDCDMSKITFILPRDRSGLPKLLNTIIDYPDLLKNTVRNLRQETMIIHLPVMKIKTYMNWGPYLQAIGIRKIFQGKSGLQAICKDNLTSYHLSKVIQKVFIDVDEFGIHREQPSGWIDLQTMEDKNKGQPIKIFDASHPFFFKVDIEEAGVDHELFSGVFYGED